MVLGIRSGTVGTEWTSFSDALKNSSPYKGNNKKGKNNYQWNQQIDENNYIRRIYYETLTLLHLIIYIYTELHYCIL